MPEISRFFGIVIAMYYREHAPPHFHARYGGHEVTVRIRDGAVVGKFPPRSLGLVLEWYIRRRDELAENWELARQAKRLRRIDPLE
jgi:hypothetical protein